MSWPKYRLDELCSLVTDGKHGDCTNQENSGYYFISCKDVKDGRINYDMARQITKDDFEDSHKRTKFEPLDIALTNSGTIGRIAVSKDNDYTYRTTFQKSVAILKPINQLVDSYFLAYSLESDIEHLISQSGGTAQKNLLLKDLRRYKVPIPALSTQRKIASIISAYNDLIENNLKRIKLLEEAAQNIYKEWFVHFRFPGYRAVKFNEDGLPEGWEKKSIVEFCKVNDKSIKKSEAPDSIGYFDISSTGTGFTDSPLMCKFNEAPSRARRIVSHGDTIFSTVRPNRKTYALILNPIENLIVSTGFAVLSPKNIIEYPFIYLTISNQEFIDRISMIAKGAAYPSVSQSDFEQFEILVPDNSIINNHYYLIDPIFRQKNILLNQTQLLKEARDILLPLLMDRRIEV